MSKKEAKYLITKSVYKNHYCIFNKYGEPMHATIRFRRKNCIKDFMAGASMTWKECNEKYGWTCHKVTVIIDPNKTLY